MRRFTTKKERFQFGVMLAVMLLSCLAGCSSSYVPSDEAKALHEQRLQDHFHNMNGPAGVRDARYPLNIIR